MTSSDMPKTVPPMEKSDHRHGDEELLEVRLLRERVRHTLHRNRDGAGLLHDGECPTDDEDEHDDGRGLQEALDRRGEDRADALRLARGIGE